MIQTFREQAIETAKEIRSRVEVLRGENNGGKKLVLDKTVAVILRQDWKKRGRVSKGTLWRMRRALGKLNRVAK